MDFEAGVDAVPVSAIVSDAEPNNFWMFVDHVIRGCLIRAPAVLRTDHYWSHRRGSSRGGRVIARQIVRYRLSVYNRDRRTKMRMYANIPHVQHVLSSAASKQLSG